MKNIERFIMAAHDPMILGLSGSQSARDPRGSTILSLSKL